VPDDFVRQLLEKCGKISKWNRAADPNTSKLTSFGFCDFEEPQGVWRALEFLHDRQLCDKRLLVKCEEKAKQTIDAWKASRREEIAKKKGAKTEKEPLKDGEAKEEGKGDAAKEEAAAAVVPLTDEQLDAELKSDSKDIEEDLAKMLKEKNKGFPEVKEVAPEEKGKEEPTATNGKAEGTKGDDKENKDAAVANEKKEESNNDSKDRKRSPEQRLSREEEKKRKLEDEKKKPQALSRHYRQSRRERDREQRVRDRERDIDKEYSYRSREFERSEDKRISNLKRDLRDLELPSEPSEREKQKFIDKDLNFGRRDSDARDWKRAREDRQRERLREAEKDAADREAELKEIEEERRQKEAEEKRKKQEKEDEERRKKQEEEDERRRKRDEERARVEEEERKVREELERKKDEERQKKEAEQKKQQEAAAAKLLMSVQQEMLTTTADKGKPATGGAPGATPVSSLFREPEDLDEKGQPRKHKPLTRLDGPPAGEVKLRDDEMRRLISQVPTDKAKAFAYEIDWQSVHDHNIIEKKLRPWVKKKVTEYLGAEEKGMIEFIMRKVSAHTEPATILAELEGFLDEEAENFTLKMWRMLIFEVLRVKAR